MRKLKLNIARLSVVSFTADCGDTGMEAGTVGAHTGACPPTYTRSGADCLKASQYQTCDTALGYCCTYQITYGNWTCVTCQPACP